MKKIFDQRFFRLLSECSQRKVSASEFAEAIEELATHVADFSITEQDYSILLRYFFYGTHALPISICVPVIRSNSRLYLVIRFSSNTFSSIPTLSGL